jgi:hypothetical protein
LKTKKNLIELARCPIPFAAKGRRETGGDFLEGRRGAGSLNTLLLGIA